MSMVLILLLRIVTVITFCKSVICIYSLHILYFSLLVNYLCQLWLCILHINLSGDIELNPGPIGICQYVNSNMSLEFKQHLNP